MNKRHTIEQRFEYSIKPLELGFLLISSPIALFAGWIGMSPLFRSPPYTINLNGDIITGTHAVSLSIIFIFFSIAWLAFTAFAYRQRKLCSKEVVLGETKINLPLTVAGEVDKSLTYEELLGTHIRNSGDEPAFVIVTKERRYRFESNRFANLREFELFCAAIEERRKSLEP